MMSSDNQDKLCNICGNLGYAEELATCSRCSTAHEHRYCMRIYNMEFSEVWVCEECQNAHVAPKPDPKEDNFYPASSSKCCYDLVRQLPEKQLRPVQTGKVNFIPVEEVIKLSSEAAMSMQSAFRFKRGASKAVISSCRKTSTSSVPRDVYPKFSPRKLKANSSSFPAQPVRYRSKLVSSSRKQKISILSMDSKGMNLQDPTEPRNRNPEESGQILRKLKFYSDFLPAKVSSWRGCFELPYPIERYEFQGQPPCRVHRKALEFSRKMPTILPVTLLPCPRVLVDLFQNDCPDLDDIALYFFPAHGSRRTKHNISYLFELMETQNYVMVSYIDGVELLIFTSEQLRKDSKDVRMMLKKTERFLWGVFKHAKRGKSSRQVGGQPSRILRGGKAGGLFT